MEIVGLMALFAGVGCAYTAVGLRAGAPGAPLVWLGLSCLWVALAYFLKRPRLLGKRADGVRHPAAWLVWPYLASAWVAWRLRTWVAEAVCHEVAPGLYLGRRPREGELPAPVALIVDLAAELPSSAREGVAYRGLPTLDGDAPEEGAFVALAREVAGFDQPVYIHCAAGRGRSAALLAAVLIAKGLARDLDDAVALMRQQRKRVRLSSVQKALVRRAEVAVRQPAAGRRAPTR